MSVSMALVDYIPVAAFLAAAVILQRELYSEMSKGAFAVFSAGTIFIFAAGLFKATWKLLYALGICDFQALNKCFFPMQTAGFVLAGLGVLAMLCHKQGDKKDGTRLMAAAAVPAVYSGTMLFVALIIIGVSMLDACLIVVAKRRNKLAAIPVFALSFVFVLAMGYLSSKDFSEAYMNWIAEAVNIVGQGLFLVGALLIRKKEAKVNA